MKVRRREGECSRKIFQWKSIIDVTPLLVFLNVYYLNSIICIEYITSYYRNQSKNIVIRILFLKV